MDGWRRIGRLGVMVGVAALAAPVAAVGQARGGVLTLQQVEQRYPRMSPVHIRKCDKGDDGLFDRGEMACVSSIYNVMYLDR